MIWYMNNWLHACVFLQMVVAYMLRASHIDIGKNSKNQFSPFLSISVLLVFINIFFCKKIDCILSITKRRERKIYHLLKQNNNE